MTTPPEGTRQLDRDETGKMFAPSAERNKDAIANILDDILFPGARVLEIASGTGQHVVHFARCFPEIQFFPTDLDPARCASVDAYRLTSGLKNIAPAQVLDAASPGWAQAAGHVDAIIIINLFHLISEKVVKSILSEAAQALGANGKLIVYGPFMRAGELTSDGDVAFHNSLIAENPDGGYKDDFDIIEWIENNWLEMRHVLEMPANNLCLIAQKADVIL